MAGMRRRCRKCREPLILPAGDPQNGVATAQLVVGSAALLREAVSAAVTRIDASDVVDNGGLRKILSRKQVKDYSAKLMIGDPTSQSDAERRRLAVLRIGQSHDCRGLELIEPLQSDSSSMVRQAVATAIGQLGDSRGVRPALAMLCDKDDNVVREAIRSLMNLADVRSIRPLLFVGLGVPLIRAQALESVVDIGNAGVSELLEILQENNALTIGEAVISLGRIGDRLAVPSLLLSLNHADVGLRSKILEALGRLGDRSALRGIISLLSDPDEKVQLSAVRAVQKIPDLRAVKPIVGILHQTQNTELRLQSVVALATSGSQKAIAILSALLPHADVALQKAIAEALGHINSPEASESLVELLHADDLSVVSKALIGMRRCPAPSAIAAVVPLAEHLNPKIRRHALEVLAEIKDGVCFGILEDRLANDSSIEVRAAAARGLSRIGNRQAIPGLERALRDESVVRSAAVLSLGTLGDESVIPALLASLKDPVPEVRYHAVSGLGKLKAVKAAASIRGMLEDSDEMVRLGAEKTLHSLGVKRSGLSHARRFASQASRFMPDGVAGILPAGATAAAFIGILAVVITGWLASTGSTASATNSLAIVRAKAVTRALCVPGSSDVILLREAGPADVWDAVSGQFKTRIVSPNLESVGHPATLMLKQGASLTTWALDGAPADARTIKLPAVKEFNLSADGAFAVYVDADGQVALWETSEGTAIGTLPLKPSPVPVISADGSVVAGADEDGNIVVLNRVTGKLIGNVGETGSVVLRDDGVFERWLFCSEGNLLAVLRSDRIVLVSVSENGLELRKVDAALHARCVLFPNKSSIYAASGTFIQRLNLASGKTDRWEVTFDQVDLSTLSLSTDESFVVASAADKKFGWVLNLLEGTTHELSPADWPAE